MCIFSLNPLREVQDFAYQHDQALQSASLVLAGQFALKRTQSLLDEIRSANAMTRRLQRGIVELHKLLSLYYVHDENRIEAAYFADLDPAARTAKDFAITSPAGWSKIAAGNIRMPGGCPQIRWRACWLN